MKAKVIETGEIIDVKCLRSIIYSRLDGNGKIFEEYYDCELEFIDDSNPLDSKKIFNFDREKNNYIPSNYKPKSDGYYITIRCGLGGIYTHLDEWKDNKWQLGVLDCSYVIAYSRDLVSNEEINKWYNEKRQKAMNKQNKYERSNWIY